VRTAFVDELTSAAARDARVWLLTGDLGFSVLERFATVNPGRFINAGVAEQNMVGVAAGMALSGAVPVVYSIANFPVMRCLEQIRNDVCYHRLPVKIVSVGAGLAYASQGYTHHGVEDLAVMRALPGMTVLAPADPVEARWAARAAIDIPGPVYIRLGKGGEPVLHADEPQFEVGRAVRMREGEDVTLVASGTALAIALSAADQLAERGISAEVLSMPTVAPADAEALHVAATGTRLIATVEEHGPVGGLHAAVLETLSPMPVRCLQFALSAVPPTVAGSCEYLSAAAGLTAGVVADGIADALDAT
jgi:transketolase